MRDDGSEQFRTEFLYALACLEPALIAALRKFVRSDYPPEVVTLHFEVFSESWATDFPVRAFFLDENNGEFFVDVDGNAAYPTTVDPALLCGKRILSTAFEDDHAERYPDLDVSELGMQHLVPWFSLCWQRAGGHDFRRAATIAAHDDSKEYVLITQR
jgi:hypothetical protein